MSVTVMSFIFKLPKGTLTSSQKFVALSYADHAHEDGSGVFPAIKTVSRKTELHSRTVQKITRQLERMGLLVADGKGPKGTNKWRFDMGVALDHPGAENTKDDENAQGGVVSDSLGGGPTPPEPPLTISKKKKSKDEPSSSVASVTTTQILDYWKYCFPKKPQPRRKTISAKVKTRIKDDGFLDNWHVAIDKAFDSQSCQSSSWFTLVFFLSVKNGEAGWSKCLRSWMDWKDNQSANGRATPSHDEIFAPLLEPSEPSEPMDITND